MSIIDDILRSLAADNDLAKKRALDLSENDPEQVNGLDLRKVNANRVKLREARAMAIKLRDLQIEVIGGMAKSCHGKIPGEIPPEVIASLSDPETYGLIAEIGMILHSESRRAQDGFKQLSTIANDHLLHPVMALIFAETLAARVDMAGENVDRDAPIGTHHESEKTSEEIAAEKLDAAPASGVKTKDQIDDPIKLDPSLN